MADLGRPVVLRERDVRKLRSLGAMLRSKRYNLDADVVEDIVAAWDGAEHLAVVDLATLSRLTGERRAA